MFREFRGDRHGGRSGPLLKRGGSSFPTTLPQLSTKPFGAEVDSIDIKSLLIEEDAPKIEHVEYVSSYNWVDVKSPTILVPGSPPAWAPPAEDEKLSPDSEPVFRDINAAKYPAYPFEPAIRSILEEKPNFDIQSIDIVGCGSTLGNVMRFSGSNSKPFRFDVDLVGDTVFFIRKEISPTELIQDLRGYGHTFPELYTTWDSDVRNSCSHQRIVRYELGGLNFLFRSESDGYVRIAKPESTSANDESSIEDAFGTLMGSQASVFDEKLCIKKQGVEVPQSQIFDIKTRSKYNLFDMQDILPRLWLSQTEKFLLAYHQYGIFDHPQITDVKRDVDGWEKNNSVLLSRFHSVLRRIVDVVRDSKIYQVEVSWDGQGPLRITDRIEEDNRRALPSDLLDMWEMA